jgi:hypothetical protein
MSESTLKVEWIHIKIDESTKIKIYYIGEWREYNIISLILRHLLLCLLCTAIVMRLEYILFVEDSTCSDVHLVEEKMNEVNQK